MKMNTKEKQEQKAKRQGSQETILREKKELYDGRTIQGTPTPRPIKKSLLAKIF